MDAGRMRTIVALLLSAEERLRIQHSLQQLDTALARLEKAPGRRRIQYKTENKLRSLNCTLEKFEATLTSTQRQNIAEIKAFRYFSILMLAEIHHLIAVNAMVPTAARQLVKNTIDDRAKFLTVLRVLQAHFDAVGDYSVWSCATLAY